MVLESITIAGSLPCTNIKGPIQYFSFITLVIDYVGLFTIVKPQGLHVLFLLFCKAKLSLIVYSRQEQKLCPR